MPPTLFAGLLLLLAYLLGGLSGSLLLGRFRNVDIRQHGSGNAGGTNALRMLGWGFALQVAAFDIGKGALAVWVALRLAPADAMVTPDVLAYGAAGAAVVGHVWPLWHGFRGGKGAATAVGALLLLWPLSVPLLIAVWLLVLGLTGYVGLATVLAAASLPLWGWLLGIDGTRLLFAIGVALFLAFTHRANLQRLWRGNESRFERARLLHRLRMRA